MTYVCFLRAVRCWGQGTNGQLGNGGFVDVLVPPSVDVATNADQVTCGNYHTCILTTLGVVLCWGHNTYGQLGNGGNAEVLVPTNTPTLSGASQVRYIRTSMCAETAVYAMRSYFLPVMVGRRSLLVTTIPVRC